MKIAESSIQFLSQHTSIEKHQKHESLATWDPVKKEPPKLFPKELVKELM